MIKRIALLCLAMVCLSVPSLFAQVQVGESGTLSGRAYFDYYWMAQNHNNDIEGKNGFWFRRIYLTYERGFSDSFSSRLRLEMNSAGDFATSSSMRPDVKDAYLKWHNDQHEIYAGISSSPTFSLTEDVWGYRSVAKSPQDLYDFGSSRDMGIAFKGTLGSHKRLHYHLFIGNGNSNKPEINKGKKLMLALGYEITSHLILQGYVDMNDNVARDYQTAQLFAGYQSDNLNIGALYSYQHRDALTGGSDFNLDLVSVFTNIKFDDGLTGFLRADHLFDPYIGGSGNSYVPFAENVESTFIVGGLDILLEEQIHLMPNIEAVAYGEDPLGEIPKTDLIPRLTLFYKF